MNFKNWININENTSLEQFFEANATRYSIEVNFHSKTKEVGENFAKICLGYVSAALKQNDYHIKHVYDDSPIRILVSSRNWDDGEWVGCVSFDGNDFLISKGYYNKMRRTISVQSTKKCNGSSASEITSEIRNLMHSLKDEPDKHQEKLKPALMKRGPKS